MAAYVMLRMSLVGHLGDAHELSARAREYANEIIFGEEWPLTPDHVNLSRVTFETSTRMDRKHGACAHDGQGHSTIRLSETTSVPHTHYQCSLEHPPVDVGLVGDLPLNHIQ
jgi:hypothetical protein